MADRTGTIPQIEASLGGTNFFRELLRALNKASDQATKRIRQCCRVEPGCIISYPTMRTLEHFCQTATPRY